MKTDDERGAGELRLGRRTRGAIARLRASARAAPAPDAPVPLKDYLVTALATDELALASTPRAVDLGEFGREADRLLLYSLTTKDRPMFASIAYLDPRGRVLLPTTPYRGDAGSVGLPSAADRRRLLLITTYGEVDTPFQPHDLDALFLAPAKAGEARQEAPALLLATPSAKLLVLRTPRTPFWEPSVIILELTLFRHLYGMEKESAYLDDYFERSGGDALPLDSVLPVTSEYKQRITELSAERMFALTRAARDYHLAIYACSVQEHVARRID